jgi:hypothetical protein
MATLVEQDPESSLMAHFHVADQFQVFVGGGGRLGKTPVAGVLIQFVGPHTPYGPIVAGPDGIHYLTLRNGYDGGGRLMPECRDELPTPRAFRQEVSEAMQRTSVDELRQLSCADAGEVIAANADGLAAWRFRLPPGHALEGPDPASGRGQHWVVLSGALQCAEASALVANSCIFVFPDDPPFVGRAGTEGLDILALQYPRRA